MNDFSIEQKRRQYLAEVLEIISRVTGVPTIAIRGDRGKRHVSDARLLFCFFITEQTEYEYTLQEIGDFISRDHATVLANKRKASQLLEYDKGFQKSFKKINAELNITLNPMTADEKRQAIALKQEQLDRLRTWLKNHPDNPYRQKVSQDVRELSAEIKTLQHNEQTAA